MKITVAIVENNPISAYDIKETVESLGCEVSLNINKPSQLIDKLAYEKPDIVITETAFKNAVIESEYLITLSQLYQIPTIVITSSYGTIKQSTDCDNISAIIHKPFCSAEIRTSIKRAIDKQLSPWDLKPEIESRVTFQQFL